MPFGLDLRGYLVFLIGILYAENLEHVQRRWIGVTALILVGLGIIAAIKNTRQKDPAA